MLSDEYTNTYTLSIIIYALHIYSLLKIQDNIYLYMYEPQSKKLMIN